MTALTLSPAERRQHRADAHHLQPVVQIGADGATEAVVKELDAALRAHGLVKVRVFSDDRDARDALLGALAERLDAAPVQHIGKLLIFWRAPAAKESAEREDRGSGPRVVKLVKFSKSGNHRATVKKVTLLGNQRISAGGLVKRRKGKRGAPKKAALA